MTAINYLTIQEVAGKLKMKKPETAVKWCIDHEIPIFTLGNKKRLIPEYEFRLAFEAPLINHLKNRYKERWEEMYETYDSEDIKRYYNNSFITTDNSIESDRYNPNKYLKQHNL